MTCTSSSSYRQIKTLYEEFIRESHLQRSKQVIPSGMCFLAAQLVCNPEELFAKRGAGPHFRSAKQGWDVNQVKE